MAAGRRGAVQGTDRTGPARLGSDRLGAARLGAASRDHAIRHRLPLPPSPPLPTPGSAAPAPAGGRRARSPGLPVPGLPAPLGPAGQLETGERKRSGRWWWATAGRWQCGSRAGEEAGDVKMLVPHRRGCQRGQWPSARPPGRVRSEGSPLAGGFGGRRNQASV